MTSASSLGSAAAGGKKARQGFRIDGGALNIEGHVEPDRAGAAIAHFVEGAFQVVANLLRVINGHRVLGDRFDHGHDVHFLYAALAQRPSCQQVGTLHLAGDDEQRDRLDPGSGHRCNDVGGTRTCRDHADAEVFADATPGFGGNATSLFVVAGHRFQALLTGQRIVEIHGAATGQQEDVFGAGLGKAVHQVIGNAHGHSQ